MSLNCFFLDESDPIVPYPRPHITHAGNNKLFEVNKLWMLVDIEK